MAASSARHAETHEALLRALSQAARWCDLPENRVELAELLSHPCYVNAPLPLLRVLLESEDRAVFHTEAAGFSWNDQARWYLDQMRRWGQLPEEIEAIPSFAGERA